MRSVSDIRRLLNELDTQPATDLEDQDLDFKDWSRRSTAKAVALVVEMAICMANGSGGTVVFGVNDKTVGRGKAIVGVTPDIDVNRLKKAVYDSIDPKLTPVFEDLAVPEGMGRLLVMHIYPGGISGNLLYGFGRFNLRTMVTRAFVVLTAPGESRASGGSAACTTPSARVSG
jgi:ATP-dependent DNA helicase RecG